MAMFGNGFRPQLAVSPMDVPPGTPAPVGTMQPAPAAAPTAPRRRGLFGRVGNALFSNPDVLINLGANLMAASGAPLGQAILGTQQQAREDEELDVLREYRRAQAAKLSQPEYQNVPGVGLVETSAPGGPRVAVAAKPEETSLIRELRAAGIDPRSEEGRMIIARAARGYQYSPEMQAQTIATQTAIAQAKAEAAAANRQPTGQLTEMQKAELRAQANRAIQAGGDRAAIMQRLREMGVN